MKWDVNGLSDIYREFAFLLGYENAMQVYRHFKGQQVTFPVKLLRKDYVVSMVSEKYDGTNLREMATEYGYSERWLRQIISNGLKDREAE